jgi:hypothetical protein
MVTARKRKPTLSVYADSSLRESKIDYSQLA